MLLDKGTVSNLISGAVLVVAYFLPEGTTRDIFLSASLFALSGGLTNSIAVTMLFDRVPGLYGSGVIETQFHEIRREIKQLILEQFFNETYLREFFEKHQGEIDWLAYVDLSSPDGKNPVEQFIESNWSRFASPEAMGPVVAKQVDKLFQSPVGAFLGMVGRGTVERMIGDFVGAFADEVKGKVLEAGRNFRLEDQNLDIRIDFERVFGDVREKVEVLLEERLQQLTPRQVKVMMEDVIRKHLGWLVVWGNVFGGAIGVAAWWIQ